MKFPAVLRLLAGLLLPPAAPALDRITVTADDTVLDRSCEVFIPPGTVIPDANGNGVLHLRTDGIEVRFAPGSVLRGAAPEVAADELKGIGIRLEGARDVRLSGLRVEGFHQGLVATRADRLTLEDAEFSGNYRQRLRSTPAAEDGADWLFPHHNDTRLWREQYGAAVALEQSSEVTVRTVRVRRGQNGILLDRVRRSRIYDNDASFLSGWGLAMWRSSDNVISRNAFDFCIRGHVEGVYNRGQDSAGVLVFEQCNDNQFLENSATHGGDGFFGFAGREALGEVWMEQERERLRRETGRTDVESLIHIPEELAAVLSRRGCNRNLLLGNDFSYASAHGIEMTFSEGNVFAFNRLVENAICGIWGGYSSGTMIVSNLLVRNGGMAYGLERGGMNLEHAADNLIVGNEFVDNLAGVHLWWDDDGALLRLPGVTGLDRDLTRNLILSNVFRATTGTPFGATPPRPVPVLIQIRGQESGRVHGNSWVGNRLEVSPGAAEGIPTGKEPEFGRVPGPVEIRIPEHRILGERRPVGARAHLRGREQILMDEWGPWDHESPLVRTVSRIGRSQVHEVRGVNDRPTVTLQRGEVTTELTGSPGLWRLAVTGPAGRPASYVARLHTPTWEATVAGAVDGIEWDAVIFPWTVDPREDLEGWRREARGPGAVRVTLASLDLPYAMGGPRTVPALQGVRDRAPGADRFGMIATSQVRLPAGRWKFTVLSDDGIRVRADGRVILENWTWHGPTTDHGILEQPADREVLLEVEHFEIDGYAVLKLGLEPD